MFLTLLSPDRPIYWHVIGQKRLGNMDEKSITDLAWRNLALAENASSRRLVACQKICNNKVKTGRSPTGDTPLTKVCASNNAPLFRSLSVDKSCESGHSSLANKMGKGKVTLTNSPLNMSGTGKEAILGLTENNRQALGVKTAYPFEGSVNIPSVQSTRKTPSTQSNSALCSFNSSASPICAGIRMTKAVKNVNKGPYLDKNHAKMIDLCHDSPLKIELQDSLSHHPPSLQRITSQKRLVRNGCIAPHHVASEAKALTKQIGDNASSGEVLGRCAVSMDKHIVDISDIVAEDKSPDKSKGKGLLMHQPIKNADDTGSVDCRDSSEFFGERGGWRTASRHLNNISHSSLEVMGHPSSSKQNIGCSTSMPQRNRVDGQLSGSRQNSRALCKSLEDTAAAAHSSSYIISGTCGLTESHNVENVLPKRKRQEGTTSINDVECRSSVSFISDIMLLDKSGEPSNPKSSKMLQPSRNLDAEVVVLSPKIREAISLRSDAMHTEELDARARQIEADERLALELQEQFYHEEPAFEVRERLLSRRSNRLLRLQNNQNPPNRGRAQSQVLSHNRTVHSRSRNVGQSRPQSISGMRRRFRFPLNMDLDMRLDILEALESVAGGLDDMGMASNIFPIQRDFNENDYEMLLALDENNHRHTGSSANQVSSLPQSQVQTEAMEEPCAICLEKPTFGETIRHLPCLHKFHKDCIDPWLLRKTSCPICKSSIT